nr:MAG TPA: hypothetical protein [Caudoviricetes sp.]
MSLIHSTRQQFMRNSNVHSLILLLPSHTFALGYLII